MSIKTLIVDDEPLARERIASLLENELKVNGCETAATDPASKETLNDS